MAKFTCPIELRKDGQYITVGSEELLPGDVIKVPENILFPCDFILLSGSVIVNEAILTGESIPVMKTSLMNTDLNTYSSEACSKHTLFGGTFSMQNRPTGEDPCLAVVTSTGFQTTKGGLVRDILYPRALKF
jgi:P-type E1-E2 ATPase